MCKCLLIGLLTYFVKDIFQPIITIQIMKKLLLAMLAISSFVSNSNATITVVNGMSHEYAVSNGMQVNGEVIIKNLGKKPARVLFYKTDLKHNCSGETQFIDINSIERSAANWIEISNNEIVLQAEQEITATYRMVVPATGKFEGSYWGCIMVEEAEAPDTSDRQKGIRVRSLIRYAVQVVANFAVGQEKNLEIVDPKIDSTDNGLILNVNIENNGNMLMKPVVVLELYDDLGALVKRVEVPTQKVYPGMCKKFEMTLVGVPKGKYSGVLVADCGENDLFGLNLTVDLTEKRG